MNYGNIRNKFFIDDHGRLRVSCIAGRNRCC